MNQQEIVDLLNENLEDARQALLGLSQEELKVMWVDLLQDPEVKALLLKLKSLDEDRSLNQKLLKAFTGNSTN